MGHGGGGVGERDCPCTAPGTGTHPARQHPLPPPPNTSYLVAEQLDLLTLGPPRSNEGVPFGVLRRLHLPTSTLHFTDEALHLLNVQLQRLRCSGAVLCHGGVGPALFGLQTGKGEERGGP